MIKKEGIICIKNKFKRYKLKKSQTTLFIILAIAIVAGIGLFFVFRGGIIKSNVPSELEPVYNYYLSCIEEETLNGASILGQQGGYIEKPEFSPGSSYMPFSNQLGFLGMGIPYWYYISGNGIRKEQIPSKEKMQQDLSGFLKQRLNFCDFSQFEKQGFEISFGKVEDVKTVIDKGSVNVKIKQNLEIKKGEISWNSGTANQDVQSNLGNFYDLAKKIYDFNKEKMFLENYAVDILRVYAPVDGVEIGCSPKVWDLEKVRSGLIEALKANVPMTKIKGDYYSLSKKENEYFVQDIGEEINANVNFIYSEKWPMKMETWPSEGGILRADPVGLQEGLGMLGFCYIPYHFVYDFAYPVLIQVYSGNEIFQFPVVILIEKNKPREGLDVEGLPQAIPELCEHKNTPLAVYTYNTNLEPIEADINFKCLATSCEIGKTRLENNEAVLKANFPQCVNGYVSASAEGYETKNQIVSSVTPTTLNIALDKKYKLNIEIESGSNIESSMITFTKGDKVFSVSYPEQKQVELTAGQYEIKAYVYSKANINLPADSSERCVDVPKSGILGTFGLTEQQCFVIDVPGQVVSNAVSGGGKQNYFVSESELEKSSKLIINAENFGIPTKTGDIQTNYNKIETSKLEVKFE